MVRTDLGEVEDSGNLNLLAKDTVIIISVQIAGLALAYLVQIFLARWMGKTEYGIYEYVISWSLVLAIPISFGLPRAVLRFISEYRVRQEWGELRGLLISSWQFIIGVGLLFCLVAIQIIAYLDAQNSFTYAPVLMAGIWLIPLQGLSQLQEDISRGIDNLLLAYGPSKLLWPTLILGSSLFFSYQNQDLTSLLAIQIALFTLLIVIIFQFIYLNIKLNREIGEVKPVYIPIHWLSVAFPLLLERTFDTLLTQTDILTVGIMIGPGAVGAYSTAAKTAVWASFILQSLNFAAAPTYAILYAQNSQDELQEFVSTITLWIFVPSIVIAAILIIFAKSFLSLFGSEFLEAAWALRIIVIGYLVDVISGCVGNLVVMTGYQNKAAVVSICCALLNLGLNVVLIPYYGIIGAAIATASTIIISNVWLCIISIAEININPTIFYSFSRLRKLENNV